MGWYLCACGCPDMQVLRPDTAQWCHRHDDCIPGLCDAASSPSQLDPTGQRYRGDVRRWPYPLPVHLVCGCDAAVLHSHFLPAAWLDGALMQLRLVCLLHGLVLAYPRVIAWLPAAA